MASAIRPGSFSRVSMQMQTNLLLRNIRKNQASLFQTQDQLVSGLRIARPSDSPAESITIMHLNNQLDESKQFKSNIRFATSVLDEAGASMSEALTLVEQAETIGLKNHPDVVDNIQAEVTIVQSLIDGLMNLANKESALGGFIFGGAGTTKAPFTSQSSGILYTGSIDKKQTQVSSSLMANFTADGNAIFGGVSSQVHGIEDLTPNLTTVTLLSNLNGANNMGIRDGSISITTGTGSVTVDLSKAITIDDVINKINTDAALIGASVSLETLGITTGLQFNGATTGIAEVGTGKTASDLGILGTNGISPLIGQDVDARLTPATLLMDLRGGRGIDTASGIIIELGTQTLNIDISSETTVEGMLNVFNTASPAIRAEINGDKTGINIFNQLSGVTMSIGENHGSTATDLGIRSFTKSSKLSEFNGGDGVHVKGLDGSGEDGYIRITAKNGTPGVATVPPSSWDINVSTAKTVNDIITLINTATVGTVAANLNATGNGIFLFDLSGGAGNLIVGNDPDNLNNFHVAEELGIATGDSGVAGPAFNGIDTNTVESTGVFSHLIALRNALQAGNQQGISSATKKIGTDIKSLINFYGEMSAQSQELINQDYRMDESIVSLQILRSEIQDIDFTEAITRFQNLQTAYQANLGTAAQLTSESLLDYLR